jgi:hypothetical protein
MSINDYISNLLNENNKDLENEVNDVFNNLVEGTCYRNFTELTATSIIGPNDILKIIDYTYLIPNLFRKCYLQDTTIIPNICISNVEDYKVIKYFPYLLEEKYIKSFLYFNFPASYTNYNNMNSFLNNIINLKSYILKKSRNTTYGSYTPGNILYDSIYSSKSMLSQLLFFNNYLNINNLSENNSKINNSFNILWDYTTGCVKNAAGNTFIIEIYNNNNIINQSTAFNINYIRYSYFNKFIPPNDFNNNEILYVYKSNIYVILEYALEVYQDIVQKFNYLIRDVEYCDKDYMNIKNIPILVKLYNIYYKNQIYSNNNGIPLTTVNNVIPKYITINTYINKFKSYYNSNMSGTVIKSILLNNNEGFVFCCKNKVYNRLTIKRSDYLYYYINIYSPSAIEVYNFWGTVNPTPDYTGIPINQFINDFLYTGTTIGNNLPYLTISNSKSALLQNTLINAGLYPLIDSSVSTNGYIYYTYNDISNTNLNSKVFLTYETEESKAVGLPIVYYPI